MRKILCTCSISTIQFCLYYTKIVSFAYISHIKNQRYSKFFRHSSDNTRFEERRSCWIFDYKKHIFIWVQYFGSYFSPVKKQISFFFFYHQLELITLVLCYYRSSCSRKWKMETYIFISADLLWNMFYYNCTLT